MIADRGLRGIVLMKRVMKIGLPVSGVLLEMFLTSWPKYHDTGWVNYWTCSNFAQKTQIEVVHGFYQKLALMCWIPGMNFVSEPLFIVLNLLCAQSNHNNQTIENPKISSTKNNPTITQRTHKSQR